MPAPGHSARSRYKDACSCAMSDLSCACVHWWQAEIEALRNDLKIAIQEGIRYREGLRCALLLTCVHALVWLGFRKMGQVSRR